MITAAVIAEYNPLHEGHKYLLDKIRTDLKADNIIVILSGDFVERGEPSVFSKEERTRLALNAGADLVLLLPVAYATGFAKLFAMGAVTLLDKLNCIDYLVFGSECGDIDLLTRAAEAVKNLESDEIGALIKEGNTFAKASSVVLKDYSEILASSNNILAIEYINALKSVSSSIRPITYKRVGSGYNEAELTKEFPSATAIRNAIKEGTKPDIKPLLSDNPVFYNDFKDLMYNELLKMNSFDYPDVNEEIYNKIKKNLSSYKDPDSFIDLLKSKNITRSRLSRALLHIMLNIEGSNEYYLNLLSKIECIRILGLNKKAESLLKVLKENSKITLVTKVPDIYKTLNEETRSLLDTEEQSSALYDYIVSRKYNKAMTPEYSKPFITV